MIVTTTNTLDGQPIEQYLGIVTGEAILGANIMKDLFAGVRDLVGGRATAYERELGQARELAIGEMTEKAQALGADAVIAVDIDYETIGANGSMLMVAASGTAVRI